MLTTNILPKKMNKTEIRTKLRQVHEILNSLESTSISPDLELALNEIFFSENELELEYQVAFNSVVVIIEYLQARIQKIKQQVKSLFQSIETDTNTMRCLESYLIKQLRDRQIDRLETQNYNLEIVQDDSQRELIIKKNISITNVPEEYQKIFLEIDRSSVRKALESGEELDFASLREPEFHLKIIHKL